MAIASSAAFVAPALPIARVPTGIPAGIPVGTLAIGKAGATNAALLAVSILATNDSKLGHALRKFRDEQTAKVRAEPLP